MLQGREAADMRVLHLLLSVLLKQCLPRCLYMYLLVAGIPIDGKTIFTSDHALKLDWLPQWIAIIGSGYIGLEFSDVYTALGSEVTFIEVSSTCGSVLCNAKPIWPGLQMFCCTRREC